MILVVLPGFWSCNRSEENFEFSDGPFTTAVELINAKEGEVLNFIQYNMKDTAFPGIAVQWAWGADSVIGPEDRLKQLYITDSGLDMMLPVKFQLEINEGEMKRFVKNYRYTMYSLLDISTTDTGKFWSHGVSPHRYHYWWQSPAKVVDIQGSERVQITIGIDSFTTTGSYGKNVVFELTQGIGISKVELYELEFTVAFPDTLRHYVLLRQY